MEDGMIDRQLYEVICAYEKSTKQYKKAICLQKSINSAANDENGNIQQVFKNDVAYSQRELGEDEPGVQKYLIVGYALRYKPEEDLTKKKIGQLKQRPVGISPPKDEDFFKWDPESPPVLVVTEILKTPPEGIQLYALLYPNKGLCTPCSIPQSLVFYRHEFRDGTTDKRTRGPSWNQNVAQHSIRPGLNEKPATQKQHKFKRAKEFTRLVHSPNISLALEMASLAAGYRETKEKWFLDEMKTMLNNIDSNANYQLLPSNPGLREFAESKKNFTMELAHQVANEFSNNWPSATPISAIHVLKLKQQLIESKIFLEYWLVKPFLIEGCYRLSYADCEGRALEDLVESVVGNVQRLCTSHESMAWKNNAPLAAILAKLEEAVDYGLANEEQMKAACGEVAFDLSPSDIWAVFADASDTDTAQAAFMQQVRLFVSGFRQQNRNMMGMVEDIITTFSKFKLDED